MAVVSDGIADLVPLSARAESTLAAITDLQPEINRLLRPGEKLEDQLIELFGLCHVHQLVAAW